MVAEQEHRIEELQRRLIGGYQLLQTLVSIRLRTVSDPESRRHLTWLSDITAAMGLLSRRLAEGGPVDFAGYLGDVADFWRRTVEPQGIRIDLRAADKGLPEASAMSLAIITHELVSNAVRHAFADGARGSIAIAYSRAADGVSLVVRDSGVGADSLAYGEGLSLVTGLVDHMGGAMSVETAPGAGVGVRIRLPLEGALTH